LFDFICRKRVVLPNTHPGVLGGLKIRYVGEVLIAGLLKGHLNLELRKSITLVLTLALSSSTHYA